MPTAGLEVRGLRAGYGAVAVLHGIDFSVPGGRVVSLLGANGAGKTTTLRAICGMVASEGQIIFAGERIDGVATERIARLGIAHVPEGRGTFADLTVEENLRLGAFTRRGRWTAAGYGRTLDFFPRLRQRLRQQAGTLSGGEQQMLAIARALLLQPKLLLLDEPSSGLAPLAVQEVFATLAQVHREANVGILLVEQDARLALAIADTAYVLETGRIVLAGPAGEIGRNLSVRRSYLGY